MNIIDINRRKKYRAMQPDKSLLVPAKMGKADGTLYADDDNYVYVRLNDGVEITVLNIRVPTKYGLDVLLGYDGTLTELQVMTIENKNDDNNQALVGDHHENHEWPGNDITWIRGQQFMPGLLAPVGGWVVRWYEQYVRIGTGSKRVETQDIDLSAYVPAPGACWVLIGYDNDGVVDITVGTTVDSVDLLDDSNMPGYPTGIYVRWAAKLTSEFETFRHGSKFNDLVDLRWTGSIPASSTTTVPPHNDLDGLQGGAVGEYYHLSEADHDELTAFANGGTSTHTQVDSHIASTSNPHSVTAAQVGAVALAPASVAASTIQPTGNTVVLTLKQSVGGTANLQEWQNSAGVVQAYIKHDAIAGILGLPRTSGGGFSLQYSGSDAAVTSGARGSFRPLTANRWMTFDIIPNGTPAGTDTRAVLSIWNTDFVSDATNFERLTLQALNQSMGIFTNRGGSGTQRPLYFSADGGSDQIYLATNGSVGINTTTPGALLHILGSTDDQQLIVQAHSAQTINIAEFQNSSGAILTLISKDGAVVVNEQGLDADSRIEGDTDPNLLYIDAGADRVGIGVNAPTSKLDVGGDVEILSTAAYYMGDPTTNGSWRFIRSGDDLQVERRESGSWVLKSSFIP